MQLVWYILYILMYLFKETRSQFNGIVQIEILILILAIPATDTGKLEKCYRAWRLKCFG